MIQFKALLIKELREAFRDKRALMVALSMSFLLPIGLMVAFNIIIEKNVDNPAIYVKFTGSEHAPKLIESLKDTNILSFADVPAENKRQWDLQSIELVIPDTFAKDMATGLPIDVILRADSNEQSLLTPLMRIKANVSAYSTNIGYKRLIVRGVDPKLLQPIVLQEQDMALPSSTVMIISLFLGLYLILTAFMSGLSISIDSSAGERERNVLEMLLCQPVTTLKIVLAKLFCSSSVSILAIVVMLVLTSIAMDFVDLTKIGATFSIDAFTFIALLMLLIPLCFLASALQLFLSFQAKSFKEAQSTVTMLIMVPSFIPFVMSMMDSKPVWLEWLPISGQSIIMEDLFKGLPVDWATLAITSSSTLILTVAVILGLAQILKSEKVVMSLS
ncbi:MULTISPECIES: ABC transporter permease [unclassified Colwellia]|uniref:ABC transporter permease n=1 Tax=unclassified Colwellia TaxID=196834 RepID=UPI0015F4E857|nr:MULTISPECIES: ABC transporter permease [unclassified Colwellia]MBA6230646.1 ABC transporter permease [Colwellia sp. MB02u-7]MBA6234577.1 ABC transporter permease [Colwellia sp. MB02u-11]MBA6255441.1 ABC transporter permease [Colwellia sp. MB3u-28]MBA6261581.1 ABC transporter permease [Colwellia sp. MB3u-41]MBA6301131.1 ABC transporter permease [Colwellia sp. MB3u-22]